MNLKGEILGVIASENFTVKSILGKLEPPLSSQSFYGLLNRGNLKWKHVKQISKLIDRPIVWSEPRK